MINFYEFYNKNGLDNEHYIPLMNQMKYENYTIDLKPIEHIIKKEPVHAYYYAKYVIKDRWIDAERVIMKNEWMRCLYSQYVIKDGSYWSPP